MHTFEEREVMVGLPGVPWAPWLGFPRRGCSSGVKDALPGVPAQCPSFTWWRSCTGIQKAHHVGGIRRTGPAACVQIWLPVLGPVPECPHLPNGGDDQTCGIGLLDRISPY